MYCFQILLNPAILSADKHRLPKPTWRQRGGGNPVIFLSGKDVFLTLSLAWSCSVVHITTLSLGVKLLNMQILESTWARRSEEVFLEMFEIEISSCVLWLEIVAGLRRGISVCVTCLSDNFSGVFLALRKQTCLIFSFWDSRYCGLYRFK